MTPVKELEAREMEMEMEGRDGYVEDEEATLTQGSLPLICLEQAETWQTGAKKRVLKVPAARTRLE